MIIRDFQVKREEEINNSKSKTSLRFQWEKRQIDGHSMINKRCTLAFSSYSWQFYLSSQGGDNKEYFSKTDTVIKCQNLIFNCDNWLLIV